jgi:putative ABC transport system permease protein
VILKRDGSNSTWQIIGVTRSRLRGPLAYVSYDAWARTQRENGTTERVQIFTNTRDAAAQAQIVRAVEEQLKANALDVSAAQTNANERVADESNFASIIDFLTAMGILLAFVGGLGLTGTMGINVLERTREIGVLRAIGAPTPSLLQIVVVEGIVMGVLSFPFAVVLSLPLAWVLNALVGRELLQASLAIAISWEGMALWFALVSSIAALASLLPAWNAIRLTVRNALAYE